MSETTVPKIYTAIPAVLEEVGAVGKNRRNDQQGYAYRSCDDICDALRPLLGKHGIFPTKKILEKAEEDRTARSGGNLNWVKLKCEWTFHASDGSSITTETFGEGMDSGDKAWNKAETGSMKNALLQVFLVMGHEDSENDSPEPEPRSQQRHNDDRRDHDRGGQQGQGRGQRQGQQQQRRQNEPMPDHCPACGATGSIHRKRGGGFVCYKSQGGCEHEWTSAAQVAAQTPE